MRLTITRPILAFIALSLAIHSAVRAQQAEPEQRRITGILHSIDPKTGAFVLSSIGADVDQALSDIMRRQGKAPAVTQPAKPAPVDSREFRISSKTEIYVKFRMSPSVANNVQQTLADLQRMIGHPVSLELGASPIASELIVWRGASRKS